MDEGNRELEFIGTLGQGGFGTVYLANLRGRDRFVRRVAVKVLHAGNGDPELIGRQRDEARLLGLLSHQAIVQVVDLTVVQGQPAVVMEYVEGVDLAAVVRAGRATAETVPVRAALDIVAVAASGLDAAYNSLAPGTERPLRAIHRDIKPANLLLTPHGGVKVLDFGIARADVEREGATGSAFFGTAAYMAPEFWLQEPIGPAYDVYALGVSLLEMVTGLVPERPPLDPKRYAELRRQQVLDLPEPVQELILAMSAFRPLDRPTAAEVQERAEQLASAAPGEPVSRFARRVVPALASARAGRLGTLELPTRVGVGRVEGGSAPTQEPTPLVPAWYERRGLLLFLSVGVGTVFTLALAGGWLGIRRLDTAADPAADAGVAEVGVAEPAPEPEFELSASTPEIEPAAPIDDPTVPATASLPAAPPAAAAPRPDRRTVAGAAPVPEPTPAPPPTELATPAPTTTAAPARESRRLSISTTPVGAAVVVDGVSRGETPLVGLELEDGSHRVRVTLDGVTVERSFEVGPDSATSLIYSFTDKRWRSVVR